MKQCRSLPVPPPLALQIGLETPLKAWRKRMQPSPGQRAYSLSFLYSLVLLPVYALAVFLNNYLKTSWHFPILPLACEEAAFMIPTKAPGERLVLRALCYSTDLCFSHGQNTEGTACGLGHPDFQAVGQPVKSLHLFWTVSISLGIVFSWVNAAKHPNHDAWSSSMGYGCIKCLLATIRSGRSM